MISVFFFFGKYCLSFPSDSLKILHPEPVGKGNIDVLVERRVKLFLRTKIKHKM